MSANTPNYRIIWHIPSKLSKPQQGSPFRDTRDGAMLRVGRGIEKICQNMRVQQHEVSWELEHRKEGIDRWEIVETSQRQAVFHNDNTGG